MGADGLDLGCCMRLSLVVQPESGIGKAARCQPVPIIFLRGSANVTALIAVGI